jgi:hypothetical protein
VSHQIFWFLVGIQTGVLQAALLQAAVDVDPDPLPFAQTIRSSTIGWHNGWSLKPDRTQIARYCIRRVVQSTDTAYRVRSEYSVVAE